MWPVVFTRNWRSEKSSSRSGRWSAWVWLAVALDELWRCSSAALERVQTKYGKIRLLIWTTSRLCSSPHIDKQRARTSLYDFTLRPLKMQEYQTLLDYVHKHSFPDTSVVLHLCYHESERSRTPQPVNAPSPAPVPPADDDSVEIVDVSFDWIRVDDPCCSSRTFFSNDFTIDPNRWSARLSSL